MNHRYVGIIFVNTLECQMVRVALHVVGTVDEKMTKEIPLTQGKTCGECHQIKPIYEFNISRKSQDGFQRMCRVCQKNYRESTLEQRREYNKRYRLTHPEVSRKASKKYRESHHEQVLKTGREYAQRIRKEHPLETHKKDRKTSLFKNYGITEENYNLLFNQQNGVCAICGKNEISKHGYLCVDHNHKTGMIRGLLCYRCNAALGQIHDNITILEKMIHYLNYYKLDAAHTYDEAAKRLFGEYAKLNFAPTN